MARIYKNASDYEPEIQQLEVYRASAARHVTCLTGLRVFYLSITALSMLYWALHTQPGAAMLYYHGVAIWIPPVIGLGVVFLIAPFRRQWDKNHHELYTKIKKLKEAQARQKTIDDGLLLDIHQ